MQRTIGSNAIKEKIRNDYFKMLIYGETNSGKTHFLVKKLYPVIKDQYEYVVVITRKGNIPFYKKNIPKAMIKIGDPDEIIKFLDKFEKQQSKNISGYNKDGSAIYHSNMLIIYDDYIDERLFKDRRFLKQFFNFRHLQASLILLSQISNKAINSSMKGNTKFSVFFNINDKNQQQEMTSKLMCTYPHDSINESREKAKKLMNEKVIGKKWGFLIVTNKGECYIPTTV